MIQQKLIMKIVIDHFEYKYWCKECVPNRIIEGWASIGNSEIDEFIKDTIYNVGIINSFTSFNE